MSNDHPNMRRHRSAHTVWDRRGWTGVTPEERLLPPLIAIAGASLIACGMSRRTWRGAFWCGVGIGLAVCAAAGLCDPRSASVRWRYLLNGNHHDYVDTELEQTFPASDPPAHMANLVRPLVDAVTVE
jgi:hypothetical protein